MLMTADGYGVMSFLIPMLMTKMGGSKSITGRLSGNVLPDVQAGDKDGAFNVAH